MECLKVDYFLRGPGLFLSQGTIWLIDLQRSVYQKDKMKHILEEDRRHCFGKEMQGFIRAKLLITHFIIVKVNTVCESRGTFSSLPGNKGRQLFLGTYPL